MHVLSLDSSTGASAVPNALRSNPCSLDAMLRGEAAQS